MTGEEPEESIQEASTAASALGGLPDTKRCTSSAVLVRSSSFEAQLPATKRGAICAGAAGLVDPDEVDGVTGAGGVNPVTLIAFHGQW